MEEIKMLISESFYTQPLMMLSALVAGIIGSVRRKKIKEFQLLIIYPIASLVQALVAYFSYVFKCFEMETMPILNDMY